MRVVLLPCLLIAGCVSAPGDHLHLELTEGKRESDERIASLVAGEMAFEKVVVENRDGFRVPAYLFTPLDSTAEPRPAVVYLHGGEHGTFSWRSVDRIRLLVNRGWIAFAPDYRGSSGYGRAYLDAADYGGREIDDVLAARDWLVEHGHAPAGKIAVLGSSHGGYNALMAVARRPAGFAACVDFYGPTDLVYRVTSTPSENPNASPGDPEKFTKMVGASVEENEQAYRDRSPRFLAEKIRAPVLIVHGTKDEVVEIRESDWLVGALRSAGHRHLEYIRVDGGHHGYPESAYLEAWDQVLEFLEDHLGSR